MKKHPLNEPATYSETDMDDADFAAFAGGSAVVFSTRAPGKDTPNEDSAALIPFDQRSGVLVVADGVGGIRAGKQASRLAVESLVAAVERARKDSIPLRDAILDGIEHANREVLALGLGAATTLAVIELQDDLIRPYHVGDSMILICGQRGKIKFQSISHSPVGYAVESGLLDESEAVHHEDRHVVSNVVGSPEMRIDIGPNLTLSRRDTLVVASDGLSDNMYSEEIIGTARKGPLPRAIAGLVDRCHENMTHPAEGRPSKPDDLTIIIYRPV